MELSYGRIMKLLLLINVAKVLLMSTPLILIWCALAPQQLLVSSVGVINKVAQDRITRHNAQRL